MYIHADAYIHIWSQPHLTTKHDVADTKRRTRLFIRDIYTHQHESVAKLFEITKHHAKQMMKRPKVMSTINLRTHTSTSISLWSSCCSNYILQSMELALIHSTCIYQLTQHRTMQILTLCREKKLQASGLQIGNPINLHINFDNFSEGNQRFFVYMQSRKCTKIYKRNLKNIWLKNIPFCKLTMFYLEKPLFIL